MMQVILSNSKHPEYGQATIPFPLAQDQYDDCVELLEKLEIGSATEQDCKVLEISSAFPVLKRMEMLTVNLDELDYLAKRALMLERLRNFRQWHTSWNYLN